MRVRIDLDMECDAGGLAEYLRSLADAVDEDGLMSCPLFRGRERVGNMIVEDERWRRHGLSTGTAS